MQPQGKARELFEAYSRLNNFAYADTRHLANHVLTKAPHCNDILERFLRDEEPRRFSRLEIIRKVFKCWAVNLGAYFLLIGERLAQARDGLRALPRLLVDNRQALVDAVNRDYGCRSRWAWSASWCRGTFPSPWPCSR